MSQQRPSSFRTLVAIVAVGLLASTGVLQAQPAAAAPAAVSAGILADGTPPLDTATGGGVDANATNGVVRTNDTVQYNFQYSFDGAGATNPVIRSELPSGMSWTLVPTECSRAGSAITAGPNGAATVLTCNLPSTTSAAASRISPIALISASSTLNVDGAVRSVQFSLDDDGAAPATTSNPADVTISRDTVPYFDLALTSFQTGTTASTPGPNGPEPGTTLQFYWRVNLNRPFPSTVNGDAIRGVMPLADTIAFRDDFSGLPPFTTLVSCGGVGGTSAAPNNQGGGPSGVTNSGAISCLGDGTMTVTNADTTLTHFPTSFGPAAISRTILFAIPNSVIAKGPDGIAGTADDGQYPFTNTLSGFDPNSFTGVSNFGTGIEPLANNTLSGVARIPTAVGPVSKSFPGEHRATNQSTTSALIIATNTNVTPTEQVQCDVFDHTAYRLGGLATAAGAGANDPHIIEYGHPATFPGNGTQLNNANCTNADAYWSTDPTDPLLGGGLTVDNVRDGIDRVRIRWASPQANISHGVRVPVRVQGPSAYNGNNLVNRAVQTLDGGSVSRSQDTLIWTLGILGVTKTATPQSTGTGNRYTAGRTIPFVLSPTVTVPNNGVAPDPISGLIVTDVLPQTSPRLTVAPGSANQPAGVTAVEYCNICDGSDWSTASPASIHGVRWLFAPVQAGTTLPPLTFQAQTTVDTPTGTAYLNTTQITAAPSANATPQTASTTVIVDAPATVLASKTSNSPVIPAGGTASYSLVARNNTATPLNHFDLIDVLPSNGDGRTPASDFGGDYRSVDIGTPPAGLTVYVSSATPAALDAADGIVDGYTDPRNPGDANYVAPGTGIWACTIAQVNLETPGCPAITDVTAVRFAGDQSGLFPAQTTISLSVNLVTRDNSVGDIYSNRFTARVESSQLAFPVRSSDASVTVVQPAIDVAKQVCTAADPAACVSGDDSVWAEESTVANNGRGVFRVRATNTGPRAGFVTVSDVLPSRLTYVPGSAAAPLGSLNNFPSTWDQIELGPGQTATLVFAATVAPGAAPVVNSASATITDEFGQTASDSDTATINAVGASITLAKSITGTTDVDANNRVNAGDVIAYAFTVENTGSVPLATVVVGDPLITDAVCPPGGLAAGAVVTCTGSYTITAADVDAGSVVNTATATGTPISGDPVVSNSSTATQPLQSGPAITLVKTGVLADADGDGAADLGETVSYSFLVTNIGDVTLTDIAVTDPKLGAVTCPVDELAPGGTTTCTADAAWTVTQAEVDAGTVTNTASVVGTPVNGADPVTGASTEDIATARTASLSLVKTADPLLVTAAGQSVTYSFAVTNTGTTTVSDVVIQEIAFNGSGAEPVATCPAGPVAPAQTITCTATYQATQGDIDAGSVLNLASATATAVDGVDDPTSETSEASFTTLRIPLLTLEKSSTDDAFSAVGDVVDYEFLVTNTGNTTIGEIAIDDDRIDAAAVCPVTTIAPDQTVTCTGSHTVTQADVDAGEIVNVATASGTDPAGAPTTTPQDTATVPGPAAAGALTVEKSSTDASYAALGDVVDYEFLVTNTGNVTLTGIAITDDRIDEAAICPVTTLAPTETTTCTGAHTVTQADLDAADITNIASATGADPAGTPVASPTDTVTVPGPTVAPGLTIEKSSTDASFAAVGDVVDYEFLVTNTGTVTVTGVAVVDALLDGAAVCPVTTLAPAQAVTCTGSHTVTQVDVNAGSLVNTASATATDPAGDPVDSPDDTVTVPGPASAPALTIDKTALDATFAAAGDVIDYEFLVTNTGNVTVSAITIADDRLDAPAVCPVTQLAPLGSTTCTGSHTVTQDEVDAGEALNAASANGSDPSGDPASSPIDTVTVAGPAAAPALTVDKSSTDASFAAVGDVIDYEFLVTNTGNVTVTGVAIVDERIDAAALCPTTVLAPGATVTCTGSHTVTQDEVDAGEAVNTASATGIDPNGTPTAAPDDTVTVSGPQAAPALSIDKSSTDLLYAAIGDVVDYEFLVTNTGTVTVTDVAIDDDRIDAPALCPVTTLAPTASVTCTGSHTVTQADLDAGRIVNVASATASDPAGGPVASPDDSVTIPGPVGAPGLSLDKSSPDVSFAAVGDVVDYDFLVTNTGTVTVSGIAINDGRLDAPAACPVTTLAPAASTTCTGSHTVTQADIDAGEVVNVATAAGENPAGDPVGSTPDAVTVPGPAAAPALTVQKSSTDASFAALGDVIDYEFRVTNTGTVTLSNLAIVDDRIDAAAQCPVTTLAPAASTTCTGSHTVTQAEVDAGQAVNVASATASDPAGTPVAAPDDTVTVTGPDAAPALTIEKSATEASFAAVGDVVDFEFLVTNTGTVTVTGITVADDLIDAAAVCPVTTLAPGASTTCTGSRTVTQADVDAGEIVNVASASGSDPAGDPVAAPDDTVTVDGPAPAPALTIEKSSPDTAYAAAGDVIDYEFVVTNTGTVTVTGLEIVDDRIDAAAVCPVTTLAPAASTTCTGSHVVTQADIDAGEIVNIASATASDPSGGPVASPDDGVTVTGPATSATLTIDKTADDAAYATAGQVLGFRFLVTNTGTVTLTDIAVADDRVDTAPVCPVTELAPAASTTCTGSHTVTAADVMAGAFTNIATATGTDPAGGRLASVQDTVTLPGPDAPPAGPGGGSGGGTGGSGSGASGGPSGLAGTGGTPLTGALTAALLAVLTGVWLTTRRRTRTARTDR